MNILKVKRLIAMWIDFTVIVLVSVLFTSIITWDNFNLSAPTIYQFISALIYLIIMFCLILSKDLTFKNASLGKKVLGLAVYGKNGETPTKKKLIKRILVLFPFFPIDIILIVLKNETRGDKKYETKVSFVKK